MKIVKQNIYIEDNIININLSPQYDFFGRNAGFPTPKLISRDLS